MSCFNNRKKTNEESEELNPLLNGTTYSNYKLGEVIYALERDIYIAPLQLHFKGCLKLVLAEHVYMIPEVKDLPEVPTQQLSQVDPNT